MLKTKKEEPAVNTRNVVFRHFFSGTYVERVDHKNRIFVPVPWRHILKDSVIITRNEIGCLVIWTPGFFQWFSNQKIEACSTEQEKQIVKRMFIGSARTVDIDPKSRMILPEDLLAKLSQKDSFLYFVGTGDYIEIWSRELFDSWKSKQMPKDMKHEAL